MSVETYEQYVKCINCTRKAWVVIPRGTLVGAWPCEKCGCRSLVPEKTDRWTSPSPSEAAEWRAMTPAERERRKVEQMTRLHNQWSFLP